jgi:hypothetical protein
MLRHPEETSPFATKLFLMEIPSVGSDVTEKYLLPSSG